MTSSSLVLPAVKEIIGRFHSFVAGGKAISERSFAEQIGSGAAGHVRFAPESGHERSRTARPFWAISGHACGGLLVGRSPDRLPLFSD
jgi:hypothetical protein